MTTVTQTFDPQALCSRKLWEMVYTSTSHDDNKAQLDAAIAELAERRHYLSELENIGKLGKEI